MRNGYALATQQGLAAITAHLETLTADQVDALRGRLGIGVHRDVEVTQAEGPDRRRVSQAFCSALPVSYTAIAPEHWRPFASLVLEAAYEATLLAGALNARRGVSNVVFLTLLGGGAFGNAQHWIMSAIRRALGMMRPFDLDVRFVSYGAPSRDLLDLADEFR